MMQTFYNIETGNAAVFDDDALISDWPEYTDVVPLVDNEESIMTARKQRNELLELSDWTQLDDSPVNKTAWATYRSALRDIPDQAGFPHDITWPIKPE
jgi:hypothetical protein